MRLPFDGKFKQSQAFNDECCRASYAKFGLKGHNGIDYSTPTGTKILAPHDGKVIESTLDPAGYGIYVKIENSQEGSILAHLREARVGVNDGVKEGDLIGYSDNSGNSTGAHLHWGYYRLPIDKKNGFNGYIDQTPFIGLPPVIPVDTVPVEKTKLADLERCKDIYNKIRAKLDVEDNETVVLAEIDKLISFEDKVIKQDKSLQDADIKIQSLEKNLKDLQDANLKLQQTVKDQAVDIEGLSASIQSLKDGVSKPDWGAWKLIIEGVKKLLGK